VIGVNKWDAVEKDHRTVKETTQDIRDAFKFCRYAPIVFISALSGKRCPRVIQIAKDVAIQRMRRVHTGKLNRVLKRAHQRYAPPAYRGRSLKLFFASQVSTAPPTFVLFFNFSKSLHFSYMRFLKNALRDAFDFHGTDLRLLVRKRGNEGKSRR
jgi:GTP-binding protein